MNDEANAWVFIGGFFRQVGGQQLEDALGIAHCAFGMYTSAGDTVTPLRISLLSKLSCAVM